MSATHIPTPPFPLLAGETAWLLDSGETVTVRIQQRPSPDGQHLPLVVSGRQLDATGAAVMIRTPFDTEAKPVALPGSCHSIQYAALAGDTSIALEMARITTLALDQWGAFLAALTAIQTIPPESPA